MSSEIEIEPIAGLPHALPPGEQLLWQGAPRWRGLAKRVFRVQWLAAYFAFFIAAHAVAAISEGHGVGPALLESVKLVPLATLAVGLLCLLAWLNARATVYTVTSRRVVMRFGVAFPMTFNLPFKRIGAADLRTWAQGEGDISLKLSGPGRIAWLHLWPHALPWHFKKAQPMLRSIPDAAKVAALLADAVRAWSKDEATAVLLGPSRSSAGAGAVVLGQPPLAVVPPRLSNGAAS